MRQDPLVRPADKLAEEALAAYKKHARLADDYDWSGEYELAEHHRKVAMICKDDAEHYSELGSELVPLF